MKHENDPDVAVVFKPVEAAGIDLIDECQSGLGVFDEAALSGGSEFLSEARLKVADGPDL